MKKLLAPAFALALFGFNAPAFAIGPGTDADSGSPDMTLSALIAPAPVDAGQPVAHSQSASAAPVNVFNKNAPQLAPGTWLPVSYTSNTTPQAPFQGLW